MKVEWNILKQFVDAKELSIQFIETNSKYFLKAFDAAFELECELDKNPSDTTDLDDFEDNYKADGNARIEAKDPSTLGLAMSPKWAPDGWHQVYHEVEFKTSQTNSIHDKGIDGNDLGFSSLKFYDANGTELTDQNDIDTDCVRTEFDFMPTFDYAIKSGQIAQIETPSSALYLWCVGAPGIADIVFCEGGINLEFMAAKNLVGLDGTAATMMPYMGGVGSNRIRFVIRHAAGYKHRIQAIFEYFRE